MANMMMPPGRGNAPPKALMQLLATLMLNHRLRGGGPRGPAMPSMPMNQNRMADLARMRLSMGGRGGPQGPGY